MYWGMYRGSRLSDGAASAGRANTKAEQTSAEQKRLESKVDALALACQSLWELVQEHTNISSDQLAKKMEQIDLRDGVKDGRISPSTGSCSGCGRTTSRRLTKCIYCGLELDGNEIFGKR